MVTYAKFGVKYFAIIVSDNDVHLRKKILLQFRQKLWNSKLANVYMVIL